MAPVRETRTTAAPLAPMLDEAAEAHGQREAVVYGRERISYDELRESVDQLAAGLTARGITPGDPVAVVLGNVPAFAVAFFAVTRSGGVSVPLNPQFKEPELDFHFRDYGVRAVLCDEDAADRCRNVAGDAEVLVAGEPLDALIEEHAGEAAVHRAPGEHAVFQFSSGSTGRPKRVPRTHAQLQAEADAFVAAAELSPEDSLLCTIPLFHTYGMGCCLVAAVRSGATLLLFEDPNPLLLMRTRCSS